MIDFEKTEDVLLKDVKANGPGLKTVDTFETTYSQKVLRELMPFAPFVLIQWGGFTDKESEQGAKGESTMNQQEFHCIVGSQSLRSSKERQRGCYPIIRFLIDQYNGGTFTVDGEAIVFRVKSVVPIESDGGLATYDVVLAFDDNTL